jgi:antitoxin component YwqK of YwqJK toxin-antitoxin module
MADVIFLKEKATEKLKENISLAMMITEHNKLEKKFLDKYGTRDQAINRMVENFNHLMTEIAILRSLLWKEYEEATSSEEVLENEDLRMIVVNQKDMNKSMTAILDRFDNTIKKLDSK